MIAIPIRIVAKERLVLSRTVATAGPHECLDFIPGSALMGAVAANLYPRWKRDRSDDVRTLFHSGKVRFGDAHPEAIEGGMTVPIPISFHQRKSGPGEVNEGRTLGANNHFRMNKEVVSNLAFSAWPHGNVQRVQWRNGWLGPGGWLREVAQGHVLKSARDSMRGGRSATGQLFGYRFIEAGQTFAGEILVEPDCESLADELRSWIGTGRRVRLGRSHLTEFGGCHISVVDSGVIEGFTLEEDSAHPAEIRLLALTDLWFPGKWPVGGLDLHPDLKDYAIDPKRTFLRFRSYSPWNAFRGFPDPERQVIIRGSVFTLVRDGGNALQGKSLGELRAALLATGVGSGLAEGLGRVLVNPDLLGGKSPVFGDYVPADSPETRSVRPGDPHLSPVERRWIAQWVETASDHFAGECVILWGAFRPRPGKSQWSQIRQIALAAKDREAFVSSFRSLVSGGAAKWKWGGTLRGTGDKTLAEVIPATLFRPASRSDGSEDVRGNVPGAADAAFLRGVAEAARRLRNA